MKCYRLPAFVLAFLLGLTPIFAQTADQTEGCAPLLITFTPPAGATSFFWEFGDNGTSLEGNAAHQYQNPGVYTVNFKESAGGAVLGSIEITIYPKPTATVTATNPMGCAPLTTTFNSDIQIAPGVNVFNYSWSYGDGTPTANGGALTDPTHTYINPGTFTVGLELETNLASCNVTTPFFDIVSASGPPNVSFITNPSPATSCTAPLAVNFFNTTPNAADLDFSWTFDNGSTSNETTPPQQAYTAEGTYEVVLMATDDNGCSGQTSQFISIGAPLVDFSFPDDTICAGASPIVMINNSGAGTYNWTFGNGAFPATSTQVSPLVQFSEGGLIDVTLEVTSLDGECSGTLTQQIFVDLPDATFVSNPTYSCTNILESTYTPNNLGAAQYIWTFDGGGTSNDQIPTNIYVNQDTTTHGINGTLLFTTSLTTVNPSGCFATEFVIDTISEPNALFYPDVTEGCAPLEVVFENRSTNDYMITSYFWDFGDGMTQATNLDDDQTHTFTSPGEYNVVLSITDELGCMDTSYVQTIFVGAPSNPDFNFTAVTICPGDSVTLTALSNQAEIDGWHFFTEGSNSFHCYQENTLTHIFDSQTGTFDVTLEQDYNGCYSQVTMADLITVQGPIAQIDYLVDCDNPYDISFRDSSMDATSVLWDFGDMSTSAMNDVVHTYADTGDYQVVLMASNPGTGCADSYDTMTVHVREISASFELDSFLCLGLPYELNGAASENVFEDCYRGYTWSFSDVNDRPITTQDTAVEHVFEQQGINYVYLETRDINGCLALDTVEVDVFGVYPSFVANPEPICIPATVNFSDFSTADTTITEWEWDFGDNMMSDVPSPSHDFTTFPTNPDSTFSVSLSLTDAVGCGGTLVYDLQVYEPISNITALPDLALCVGETVDFSASDFTEQGSNLTWNWDFGNTQTSNQQNFTATYPTAGTYTVTLDYTEIGSNCVGPQQTVNVSVQDFPIASFSVDDDISMPICAPAILEFTNTSTTTAPLTTIDWDFGLGGSGGSGEVVSATFPKGVYTTTLMVSTSNGCSDETDAVITLIGPSGTFAADKDKICPGDEVTFTISDLEDVSSWNLDFGDGVVEVGSGLSVTHVYDNLPDGTTLLVPNISLVDETSGCTDTTSILIPVQLVQAGFDGDITGCVGTPVTFNNTTSVANLGGGESISVFWDLDNGLTSTEASPTTTYDAPGTYMVELVATTSPLGCTDSVTVDVLIDPEPDVTFTGGTVCNPGDPITLVFENVGMETYDFVFGDLDTTIVPDQIYTFDTTVVTSTTFVILTTSQNVGCTTEVEAPVDLVEPLIFPEDFETTVCPGTQVLLPLTNPGGIYNYTWSYSQGDGPTPPLCTNCNDPIITVPVVTAASDTSIFAPYIVSLNASLQNNECPQFVSYLINVVASDIPNAFTPDNDGVNDFFNVPFGPEIDVSNFQVFNRWGQLVYNNERPTEGWDGYHNGKAAASDVYLFIIETAGNECMFSGNVTLLR